MSNTKGVLKLAYIKGSYTHTINVKAKLGIQGYYCLTVMVFRSGPKHSAYISACHASDNTNNHYGISNNRTSKIEAIRGAIKDSGLKEYNLTDDNLNLVLIELAKELNPNMTNFMVA